MAITDRPTAADAPILDGEPTRTAIPAAPPGRIVDLAHRATAKVLEIVAPAPLEPDVVPLDPPPADGEPDPGRAMTRMAIVGFVALLAITVGDSFPSSPFKFEMPGVWYFGAPRSGSASTFGVYFVLVAVYGGLLLLMRVWWWMLHHTRRHPGLALKRMWWTFGLWSLPMLVVPPLFSRDVYSYAAQGEMVTRHLNPYFNGPFQLGSNSFTGPVDPLWGNAPAPYGPLFLQMDGFFARITGHNELATVVLLRLSALAGVVMVAMCVRALSRQYRRDAAGLFALMILNPVTILHLVGGAHNDALMLGFLAAGIVAAKDRRPVVAAVLCTLGAAIKAPAAIGLLYVGWTWLGPERSVKERMRPLVTTGILSFALMAFFSLESGLGWGWVKNLNTPGAVKSWLAPSTELGFLTADVLHFFSIAVSTDAVIGVTRGIGLVATAIAAVWLLLNSDRIGALKALGLTLLLLVLLGPVDQPWYLSWGLMLLAPVAFGRLRSLVIGLSVVTAFLELPGASQLVGDLLHGDPLSIALTLLWLLFILAVPLGETRIVRRGLAARPAVGLTAREAIVRL